ncbi:ABC transporter permease subunit [Candidatus Poriferisocius sp.]|uniref:ABC transporter permease subunit n=1 Tax=Candidatus Poriferisocius sp. TaxID=3101276 RepID=UPI003B02A5D0
MTEARIYDRGYVAYEGPRHSPGSAMLNLAYHTVQRVLGLKRSNWQKVLPAITLLIAFVPAIVFVGIAALLPGTDELPMGKSGDYYDIIVWALFLFAAFVAPEAVCTDRRSGMLGLYLASPLNRDTYLVAKFAAVVAVLGIMTMGPQLLMLIAFTLDGTGPDGVNAWFAELGRLLAAGVMMAVFWASLSLAISSLTDRRTRASVAVFLIPLVSLAIGRGLSEGAKWGDSWALVDLISLPVEAVFRIYGEVGIEDYVIRHVDTWSVFLAAVGFILAAGLFARWRYQNIEVKG